MVALHARFVPHKAILSILVYSDDFLIVSSEHTLLCVHELQKPINKRPPWFDSTATASYLKVCDIHKTATTKTARPLGCIVPALRLLRSAKYFHKTESLQEPSIEKKKL